MKKRIALVSDVAIHQSGVATTMKNTVRVLEEQGHEVFYLNPTDLGLYTLPLYGIDKHFQLALPWPHYYIVKKKLCDFNPDHIHISTELLLGQMVQSICLSQGWRFSTAFHSMVPNMLEMQVEIPAWATWTTLRAFHKNSSSIMNRTPAMMKVLDANGFQTKKLKLWSGGVDTSVFYPREIDPVKFPQKDRPIYLFVGRVHIEKNIDAFLEAKIAKGTKYVVGDGPAKEMLERKYTDAKFLGYLAGDQLATAYSSADVVVFPSWNDTFGLTIIEALATGTPVAAYPATGPIDIIGSNTKVGALNKDLAVAMQEALANGQPDECIKHVRENYTREAVTQQFLNNLVLKDMPKDEKELYDGTVESMILMIETAGATIFSLFYIARFALKSTVLSLDLRLILLVLVFVGGLRAL